MSRAFVKESDDGGMGEVPERERPAHANYVTARGLAQLQARVAALAAQVETGKRAMLEGVSTQGNLRTNERDLRYFRAQLERAELIDSSAGQSDVVHFGAQVTLRDETGIEQQVRIVGDDEADAAAGDISWASPLARALIGARRGEVVAWQRPAGTVQIEILSVQYAA